MMQVKNSGGEIIEGHIEGHIDILTSEALLYNCSPNEEGGAKAALHFHPFLV
jgi:hypothetical protein